MHLAQLNRPQQLHDLIVKGSGGLPPLEAELLRRAAAHHQARRRRDGGRKKGWGDGDGRFNILGRVRRVDL